MIIVYGKNLTTLPHEIRHVIEFNEFDIPLEKIYWQYNFFHEIIPKLEEHIFMGKIYYNYPLEYYLKYKYDNLIKTKYLSELFLDDLKKEKITTAIEEFITNIFSIYIKYINIIPKNIKDY